MKFAIATIVASLALATLGFAAPAPNAAAAGGVEQRSPNPEVDWKTKLGWYGKITPVEEVGETVSSPEVPYTLAKRTLGGLYLCPNFDWGTTPTLGCTYTILGWSQCITTSPQTYRYTLSSVGPDPGTWCVLYQSTDCSNGSEGFTYPGLARLDGQWAKYNDNTGSIKCWW